MGRELSFANPAEFFTVINEAFYHTFLPVVQLCLIPIILYVLDLIFHFKFLRKLEIVKWAGQHHISGAVVFIIPVALSIPNAIISGVEDFYHRYSNDSAITEVAEELNQLPAGSAIAFSNQTMRYFATIYEPLLTNNKYFYDMTTGTRLSVGMGLDGKETVAASELVAAMPDEGHVYFLLNTDSCTPTFKSEPQSNWEYLGLIRQLDDKKAFDFYKVK